MGLSIAVHVVLAVVAGWVRVLPAVALPDPIEVTELRFSFARSERTAEKPQAPSGEVPFEEPRPQLSADLAPPPPDPGMALAPVPAVSSEPEPSAPGSSGESGSAPPVEAEPGTERLPLDPRGENRPGTDASGEAATGREFDLQGAIRDFGRSLDRERAESPPTTAGSGPPRNVFVPDPVELPTTGFGVGNLTFETRDFDWEGRRAAHAPRWRRSHRQFR